MGKKRTPQSVDRKKTAEREPYEKPQIIYEGLITTAAGSPIRNSEPNGVGPDPADIFRSAGD